MRYSVSVMETRGSKPSELSALLGSIDVGGFLPADYTSYRAPLADALAFFLERLTPSRQADVLAAQAAMAPSTDAACRLVALMRRCPTLHKLGQVVARDRRLDEGLRRQLQSLETGRAVVPVSWIAEVVRDELDPDTRRRLTLEDDALAEASVAVVIGGHFEQDGERRDVVLKILKPGAAAKLEEELEILESVGSFLDERTAHYEIPELRYRSAFEEVRTLLLHEIDLSIEQSNLQRARHLFDGWVDVSTPEPIDALCTPSMTGMSRLYGSKVTEQTSFGPSERRRLAASLVEAMLVRPLFDPTPTALFHADPHAGNLLGDDEGRLGILDWSLTGRLTKSARERLVQIVLGALTLDRSRMRRAVAALALGPVDDHKLDAAVESAVAELRVDRPPGLAWLVSLMDRAVTEAGLRLDGDLMAFRKTLLTLEGVLEGICEHHCTDRVLVAAAWRQLQREWPTRWLRPWHSREFDTHVSTADLAGIAWTAPQAMMRLWAQSCLPDTSSP